MEYLTLKNAIFLGGLAHFGILSGGLVMTRVLNWKVELKKVDELSEHIIWTHGAYVWFTILFFGVVSVGWPELLMNGGPLGSAISAFITFFWGLRLIIQFFYFDASPYLTSGLLKLGFHSLTLNFAYFTVVYGLSLIHI